MHLVDLFTALGPCNHELAAGKNQEHHFRLLHPEDQSWEQLRVVPADYFALHSLHIERLQSDEKANIVGADHVLYPKIYQSYLWVA